MYGLILFRFQLSLTPGTRTRPSATRSCLCTSAVPSARHRAGLVKRTRDRRALWALGRTGTDDMPGSNPHEVPPPPTGPRLPFAVAGCTVNSNPWAQAHHSPCRSVQNLTLTSPKAESGANLFRKEAPAHRMRWDPKASTKLGSMLPMST